SCWLEVRSSLKTIPAATAIDTIKAETCATTLVISSKITRNWTGSVLMSLEIDISWMPRWNVATNGQQLALRVTWHVTSAHLLHCSLTSVEITVTSGRTRETCTEATGGIGRRRIEVTRKLTS